MSQPRGNKITASEHAVVRRLNDVHAAAHRVEKSGNLNDWALVYGFFIGAGLKPKRAHEFAQLYCYCEWGKDPIFAESL